MIIGRLNRNGGSQSRRRIYGAALSCCIVAAVLVLLLSNGSFGRADAASGTIPAGTVINQATWQQYQEYMPEGMKAVFRGDHFFHFPQGFQMKIAATKSIPLPKFFNEATQKYSATVKLVKVSTGGYALENYKAGLPFPDPLNGDPSLSGQRVFWNLYFRYHPRIEAADNCSYILDQYGNMTRTADEIILYSQLAFNSDPQYPETDPHAGPYYYVFHGYQTAPEANKYFTALNLLTQDTTKDPELYMFIPTLRRSLRLSQSARCAPLFGSDLTFDDAFEGPPALPHLFKIEYVGEKKIVALMHANPDSFSQCGSASAVNEKYYLPGGKGVVPIPNAASGDWELRDVYAISLKRLPEYASGYCYGNRVIYVDKETYFPIAVDLYDAAGGLYKWAEVFITPGVLPGGAEEPVLDISGQNTAYAVNFQDRHATVFIGLKGCNNSGCDAKGYGDATRWALPEGLSKIMQ